MINSLKKVGLNLIGAVAGLAIGYAGYFLPLVSNTKAALYFAGCMIIALVIYGMFTNKVALWLIITAAATACVTGMAIAKAYSYQGLPEEATYKFLTMLFGLASLGFHLTVVKILNSKI